MNGNRKMKKKKEIKEKYEMKEKKSECQMSTRSPFSENVILHYAPRI